MLTDLRTEIKKHASEERKKAHLWYFKTGKGEYGEHDQFIGVTVPQSRAIAKQFKDLSLADAKTLLMSPVHEERLIALFILNHQFAKGDEQTKKNIIELYLSHTKWINNWDLVDSSASQIVGTYLLDKKPTIIMNLAKSSSLWERRIAMIATAAYIKKGHCELTYHIAEMLLPDTHDLIHKAVGWMLREAGKNCGETELELFLKKHLKDMPRTALRYAIEKFSEKKRQAYLKGAL